MSINGEENVIHMPTGEYAGMPGKRTEPQPDNSLAYTVADLAGLLKKTEKTIRLWCENGRLKDAYKVPGPKGQEMWMIPMRSIQNPEVLDSVTGAQEAERKSRKLDQAVKGSSDEKYSLLYDDYARALRELADYKGKALMLEAAERKLEDVEAENKDLAEKVHEKDLEVQAREARAQELLLQMQEREKQLELEKQLATQAALNLTWAQRRKIRRGELSLEDILGPA